MKTLKKQAVFPVLMLLVVTALASIGSAFAWFNIATNAEIETIEAQASAAGAGIMLSADNDIYTYDINIADCISLNVPGKLQTVSTRGLATDGLLTFFNAEVTGIVGDVTKITSTEAVELTIADDGEGVTTGIITKGVNAAGYIAFDIFFQVIGNDSEDPDEEVKIYLNLGSQVVDVLGTGKLIVDAMRVAFINLGNVDNEHQDDVEALSGDFGTVIWEPGTQEDNYYGLIAKSEVAEDPFNAYELVTGKSIKVTTNSTTDLVMTAEKTVAGKTEIATIKEGFNKIRVYIWLEGNDEDCVNDISLKDVTIDLKFFSVEA